MFDFLFYEMLGHLIVSLVQFGLLILFIAWLAYLVRGNATRSRTHVPLRHKIRAIVHVLLS